MLAALMAVVSVNIWTGAPLLSLWIGSKIQSAQGQLSMLAVFVVVVLLGVLVLALATALSSLGAAYDSLTGRPQGPRQAAPWLRSMRAESQAELAKEHGLTGLERIMVVSVVLAMAVAEVWFFFFAGSPI